jgi:cation diffusion facilitator family transporter
MAEELLQRSARFDVADRVIRVGIVANLLLVAIKMSAGHFGRSEAVFADGVESACDLAVAIGTLLAMRISRAPSDSDHPYGHGRAENIAALMIGAVILATGAWIMLTSVHSVFAHAHGRPAWIAVVAAAFTVVSKEILARYTLRVGGRSGSPAITALAADHRKDALTSIATLVGAGCAMLGATILDPIVAGLTALLILKTGWETFLSASHELMDAALPEAQIREVTKLAESVAGVEHVHEIKGRRAGQYMIIDLKLEMDSEMTVRHSHEVATRVKRLIFDAYPTVGDVMIHVNPHDDPDHEDLVRL